MRPLYLNGEFVETSESFAVHNPADGSLIDHMSSIGREQVGAAIAHAHSAFEDWRGRTAIDRGRMLRAVADSLERREEEIAAVITLENGKPLSQSAGEVRMTADHFRWFAEEARRTYGRIVPQQVEGKRHLILKEPVGVCAAIAPWNFPLILSARKTGPALAAGCPVILKPARYTPLSSVLLAECMDEAGIPPGVFQLVAGPAGPIADEFLQNPLCRKISFTGSTAVGKELIRKSADTVTNLSLELGGHAPVLVFEDADIDLAVEGALVTKFRNTGQSCIAANRILVQEPVYEAFATAFTKRTEEMVVGEGTLPDVEIGPMIDKESFDAAMQQIEGAVKQGAELLTGGELYGDGPGYFLKPTVLGRVPSDAECMIEETFAPVAPLTVFTTEEEGIAMANATEYGLAAYAYTSNLNRAFRVMEKLEAGTVGINDAVPSTSQCPFGGFKQSGIGRELGSEGIEAYLETKHVSLGSI